ncbi:MAG: terminase large subunit [Actinomycetota bacterium]|nr:terminase large subunit [Actinomycetota bacterium]
MKTRPRRTSVADPVTSYARAVARGKAPAGPHVRAACARHLRDLDTAKARGLRWDKAEVARVLGFFRDVLRLAGGEHEGKPFELEPWQVFVVGSLFGWKGADGFRRFRVAYIEAGKGAGKSPLAAGIGLYGLTSDGESRAEVYTAATKKDQAMILFRDAVAMVDQSPALSSRLLKSGTNPTWNLAHLASGSFFRPVASDDAQSGPRPHIALLDEIHEHRTGNVVEMMRAGTKGRRQALIFMITNSGHDRTSVCYDYHEYGAKVSAGEAEDDSFFAYICGLDDGDDPFEDRTCWAKANPSLGVTIQEKYIEEQVLQAKGMPAKEAIVRRLNFCQWVDAANPWIDGDLWRSCQVDPEAFPPDDALRERPCFLALDLSGKRDLTALAAVWPDDEGGYLARAWFWTPADTLVERERMDRVPYAAWARADHLFAVPGRSINYAFPARFVGEMAARFNVVALAFDPYRMEDFQRELDEAGVSSYVWEGPDEKPGSGIRLVRHGQGYGGGASATSLWMPRSVTATEEVVLSGRLRVRRNPVLTSCSAAAVLVEDPAGNKKWDKRKSTGRIDGIVALSMAQGLAEAAPPEPSESVYEQRGVRTF